MIKVQTAIKKRPDLAARGGRAHGRASPDSLCATKTIHQMPLDQKLGLALPTAEAAAHPNRACQTLRIRTCTENGPLRPARGNGRLAWRVADICRVLGGY